MNEGKKKGENWKWLLTGPKLTFKLAEAELVRAGGSLFKLLLGHKSVDLLDERVQALKNERDNKKKGWSRFHSRGQKKKK